MNSHRNIAPNRIHIPENKLWHLISCLVIHLLNLLKVSAFVRSTCLVKLHIRNDDKFLRHFCVRNIILDSSIQNTLKHCTKVSITCPICTGEIENTITDSFTYDGLNFRSIGESDELIFPNTSIAFGNIHRKRDRNCHWSSHHTTRNIGNNKTVEFLTFHIVRQCLPHQVNSLIITSTFVEIVFYNLIRIDGSCVDFLITLLHSTQIFCVTSSILLCECLTIHKSGTGRKMFVVNLRPFFGTHLLLHNLDTGTKSSQKLTILTFVLAKKLCEPTSKTFAISTGSIDRRHPLTK